MGGTSCRLASNPDMKQSVVIVASHEGKTALAPVVERSQGTSLEHITRPEVAAKRLSEGLTGLLILVHPLPDYDTVAFWQEINRHLGSAKMPITVVVASPEELANLEPLEKAGVHLVSSDDSEEEIAGALSHFLCEAQRVHARVMVKFAIELGAGKVLRIAQTVNVSRSGLLIRSRERFPLGSTLDLKMELPGDKEPIEARAEVVRVTDPEVEKVQGLGARFVWFRAGDEERFDEFMRQAEVEFVSGPGRLAGAQPKSNRSRDLGGACR